VIVRAALLALALAAPAAAQAAGLRQVSAHPLAGGAAAAVSPDGRHVYVASNAEEDGTLLVYARDAATGALTEVECLAETERDGCTGSRALYGLNDVVVSHDGATVYALGTLPGSVGVYDRDPETGRLTERQCFEEGYQSAVCPRTRFENIWKLALTADGTGLIVGGSHLTRFAVAADGSLSDPVEQRVSGARTPAAIAAGPSPAKLFFAGGTTDSGKLSVLSRDTSSGEIGALACAGEGTSTGRPCRPAAAIGGPADLAVAPDGRAVYLAATSFTASGYDPFSFSGTLHSSAIGVYSPVNAAQRACLLFAGQAKHREGCERAPKDRGPGFHGASALAVTPNGKYVVAGFEKSRAVALLRRNPSTQRLAVVPGRGGCVRDAASPAARRPRGCQVGRHIHAPTDVAISPDSRSAYVTSRDGLTVYALR
jgi:DNA-binding beta-propeller fold protein YncE